MIPTTNYGPYNYSPSALMFIQTTSLKPLHPCRIHTEHYQTAGLQNNTIQPMLSKIPVPARPSYLDNSRAWAYCAYSRFNIFYFVFHFSLLSPSLWEPARYILKYCLKRSLSPKQPNNLSRFRDARLYKEIAAKTTKSAYFPESQGIIGLKFNLHGTSVRPWFKRLQNWKISAAKIGHSNLFSVYESQFCSNANSSRKTEQILIKFNMKKV